MLHTKMKHGNAVDCACGDGIVTRDLLDQVFDFIEMFDPCGEAYDKVSELTAILRHDIELSQTTM